MTVGYTTAFCLPVFASSSQNSIAVPERNPGRVLKKERNKTQTPALEMQKSLPANVQEKTLPKNTTEIKKTVPPLADGSYFPLPERNPKRVPANAGSQNITQPEVWSEQEIVQAERECDELLKGSSLAYEKLPPIKEGSCGSPAPILLKALGEKGEVLLQPHATINCKMAKALQRWFVESVQPQARALLGGPVTEIKNAASYSCRNRYNSAFHVISEHAFANAQDISEFTIANRGIITLLEGWGPTRKELKAKALLAAQKAAEQKAKEEELKKKQNASKAHVKTEPSPDLKAQNKTSAPSQQMHTDQNKKDNRPASGIPDSGPVKIEADIAKKENSKKATQDSEKQDKKPEKKADDTASKDIMTSESPIETPEMKFLKTIHQDACKIFGTVLGPESNDAHKNHFHFDLAERKHKSYCE